MLYSLTQAAAPPGVTVIAKPKFIFIRWGAPAQIDLLDHYEVRRYANLTDANADTNPTLQISTTENQVHDAEELTAGTTYYYRVYWIDIWNNASALSSEQHAVWKVVQEGDTDQTAPGTPSAPTVAQTSKDENGDGTIDMGLKLSIGAFPAGGTSLVFKVDEYQSDGTTLIDTYFEPSHKLVKRYGPVIAGHVYKVSVAAKSFNGTEGSFSSVTTLQATGKTSVPADPANVHATSGPLGFEISWNASADLDYDHTEMWLTTNISSTPVVGTAPTATSVARILKYYLGAAVSGYYAWVRHVNRSGAKSSWIQCPDSINSTYVLGGTAGAFGIIGAGTVDETNLADNAIREKFVSQTNTSQAVTASTVTTIETVACAHGSGCNTVDLWLSFRNASGGARTFDVTLEDGTSVLASWPSVQMGDNGYFGQAWTVAVLSGSSTNFRLRVNPTAGATVNNTKLTAVTGRR